MLKKSPLNLSTEEVHTIDAIGLGQSKMKDVSAKLGITFGSLTSMMDKLVEKGYVERKRSDKDRRVVFARLTLRGRLVYREHRRLNTLFAKKLLGMLDSGEREAVFSAMRKIRAMELDFIRWRI